MVDNDSPDPAHKLAAVLILPDLLKNFQHGGIQQAACGVQIARSISQADLYQGRIAKPVQCFLAFGLISGAACDDM
jgi:hypothetical protein